MSPTSTLEKPADEAQASAVPERPKFELSGTAVVAGALAALTSAFLGSQLGTAGTIIGAAVGSTIGAVATALYSFALKHTTRTVAVLADRGKDVTKTGTTTLTDLTSTNPTSADLTTTRVIPAATDDAASLADEATAPSGVRSRWSRSRVITAVVGVVVAAAAAFALSMALITGFEVSSGKSLDQTSIGSVTSGQTATTATTDTTAEDSTSAADTTSNDSGTTTATDTTATPEATATSEATASPTPTSTTSPTASATPTATSTSTSAATPGSAATP